MGTSGFLEMHIVFRLVQRSLLKSQVVHSKSGSLKVDYGSS